MPRAPATPRAPSTSGQPSSPQVNAATGSPSSAAAIASTRLSAPAVSASATGPAPAVRASRPASSARSVHACASSSGTAAQRSEAGQKQRSPGPSRSTTVAGPTARTPETSVRPPPTKSNASSFDDGLGVDRGLQSREQRRRGCVGGPRLADRAGGGVQRGRPGRAGHEPRAGAVAGEGRAERGLAAQLAVARGQERAGARRSGHAPGRRPADDRGGGAADAAHPGPAVGLGPRVSGDRRRQEPADRLGRSRTRSPATPGAGRTANRHRAVLMRPDPIRGRQSGKIRDIRASTRRLPRGRRRRVSMSLRGSSRPAMTSTQSS